MRAFLAIELDEETRKFLCGIQKNFLTAGIKGNYSLTDNLHLTIKFLAEINAGQTEKLAVMIKNIASRHDAFEITNDSLGRFNKGNRMILWAGIRNNISLQELYRDVDLNVGS
jgi:2'-5' RNA ligase